MHLIAMLRRFSLMIPFVKLLLTQDGTAAVRPGKANFTIDDEYGDPSGGGVIRYNPSEGWGQGANCSGCWAMVDKTFAFDQTWHDSTADSGRGSRNMSITFSGTDVYVYFILDNHVTTGTTATALNITLDGRAAGTFTHTPNNTATFVYNALVYSTSNLTCQTHTVSLSADGQSEASLFLFDYAIYSTDMEGSPSAETSTPSTVTPTPTVSITITTIRQSSPTSTYIAATYKHPSAGVIVGAVFGGLSGVAVMALFLYWLWRRHHRLRGIAQSRSTITPFLSPGFSPKTSTSNEASRGLTIDESQGHRMGPVTRGRRFGTGDDSVRAAAQGQREDHDAVNIAMMQVEVDRLHMLLLRQETMFGRISDPPGYLSVEQGVWEGSMHEEALTGRISTIRADMSRPTQSSQETWDRRCMDIDPPDYQSYT